MDPRTEGAHSFVIRNQGGGPLELSLGDGLPPGIRGEIFPPVVPPGQAAEVRITWTTDHRRSEYLANVLVATNDRSNEAIWLTVRGRVRVRMKAEPERLSFSRVEPGQAASAATLVYSPSRRKLPVLEAACSVAGATCTVVPATADALASVEAEAGCLVTVTLPEDMPSGAFAGVVRVRPRAAEQVVREPLDLEVPFSGRVLRRLAVYGAGVDENGVVDLGIYPPGALRRHRLALKVRDHDPRLALVSAEFRPDFLRAALQPAGMDGKDHLYHLDITIPADAPECIYRGVSRGEMKLYFAHLRIPELTLSLAFAVMRRP
jgi:hypothetical protein